MGVWRPSPPPSWIINCPATSEFVVAPWFKTEQYHISDSTIGLRLGWTYSIIQDSVESAYFVSLKPRIYRVYDVDLNQRVCDVILLLCY